MSLASTYAASYALGQTTLGCPAPFVTSNWRAEVTTGGSLRLVQTTDGGNFDIVSPTVALSFAVWLTTTFG